MKHNLCNRFFAAAALVCGTAFSAMAQIDPASMITSATSQVKQTVSPVVNLVLLLVGIVGVAFCVPGLLKYVRGTDREGSNALTKVGIGVIIAVIIIYVIKTVVIDRVG